MNFKFQILDTLYFEYYNNNHYTFAYNQSIPDSVLYCSRRRYRWGWYIFEFLVDSYTTGVLSTSLFKIFLLHLEIQYLALHFLGFYDYFLNKCFFCKFQLLGTLNLVPGSWFYTLLSQALLQMMLIYFWISWRQSGNWDFTYLFLQGFPPPFRNFSWEPYLYSLNKYCIVSSRYWAYSNSNSVTDGTEIVFNFLVTVLKLGFFVPLSSGFSYSF